MKFCYPMVAGISVEFFSTQKYQGFYFILFFFFKKVNNTKKHKNVISITRNKNAQAENCTAGGTGFFT